MRSASWRGPSQRVADATDDLARHGGPLQQRVGEQLGRARQRARHPLVLRWRDRHRVRGGVEEDGGDVHAGDAVHQRVVGLGQQGKAVVGKALDQPELPQRAVAVQRLENTRPVSRLAAPRRYPAGATQCAGRGR